MSEVLVPEVESDREQNFEMVVEEDRQYLNSNEHIEKKVWMSLDDTISVCSDIILKIIKITERFKLKSKLILFKIFFLETDSLFDSYDLFSAISLNDYFKRITNYMKIDKTILMLSLMNLDRFLQLNQDFILSKFNCHK